MIKIQIRPTKRPRGLIVLLAVLLWLCVAGVGVVVGGDYNVVKDNADPNDGPLRPDVDLATATVRPFAASLYHAEQEPFRSFPCLPKHIHLAQANNVDTTDGTVKMTISFTLDYTDCHWQELRPLIRYAPVHDDDSTAPARIVVAVHPPLQFNYSSDKTPHGGVFQSDWIYHLELPGVQAGGILYWYRIAVPALETPLSSSTTLATTTTSPRHHRSVRGSNGYYLGETPTYTFRSPPLPGAPTSLAMVGDLGQTQDSLQTMMDIYKAAGIAINDHDDDSIHAITQLLIAGDLSYADADPARWTSWLALIEPLIRSLPLHVVAGNHEVECTKDYQVSIPYENYFRVPNRLGDAITERISFRERTHFLWGCDAPSDFLGVYNYGNSFYSYHHGLVHVIVLNSYTTSTPGSPQYEWLHRELQVRFDRSVTPWLLVVFHCPLYTLFEGHVNERQSVSMKLWFEPLFVQYGVNVVVSGHDHAYMRTTPLAYDKAVVNGTAAPIYLILGAGGNREGHARGYRWPNYRPDWAAASSNTDFGFAHWYIPNATHALYRWVNNNKSDSAFSDRIWMTNLYYT